MDHNGLTPRYWDAVLSETRQGADMHIWRSYMKRVYARLIRVWLSPAKSNRYLKTDLFEEAVSQYTPLHDLGSNGIGIDISLGVVRAARRRLICSGILIQCVVADLRCLPLKAGAIDRIISGSSLDHFSSATDIDVSLTELARVLAPGGVLGLTLDNLQNPVVWLRNRLPYNWLHTLRLVPYYVGDTYNREQACGRLASIGLKVTHVSCVSHVPRTPAIWLAWLLEQLGWGILERLASHMFDSFEILAKFPTRYYTGYYLAIRAEKAVSLGHSG